MSEWRPVGILSNKPPSTGTGWVLSTCTCCGSVVVGCDLRDCEVCDLRARVHRLENRMDRPEDFTEGAGELATPR